ncbi:M23 family metallopeptidase [Ruegeria sp. WL0004]|uniref:M23 family metallopeptidase n=1 Tax=Ruegeria marisflavi TaxID=2984152 RepID=A0ABT2WMP0_9RHOB|nr:M23 family metallopeptidase [Ruegeria sp. WL0004]MCU9837165.1 M23 family metallopeptidase [Ruegeria sp. WL0004]
MAQPHIATKFQHPVAPDFSYWDSTTGALEWNGFGELNAGVGYHLGDDYFPTGSNIEIGAIANGYAIESGENAGLGFYVVVRHDLPDGTEVFSLYAHMESLSTVGEIEKGSGVEVQVDIGETLGIVGSTGTGGYHLHLEISDFGDKFSLPGSGVNYAKSYDNQYSPAFSGPDPVSYSPDGDPVLGVGIGIYDPSNFIESNNTTAKVMANYGPTGPTMAPEGKAPEGIIGKPSSALADPSFESDGLAAWTTLGSASIVEHADIDGSNNSTDVAATATDGLYFAMLTSFGAEANEIEALLGLSDGAISNRTGIAVTNGAVMATTIDLGAREDSFYFDFYFDSNDYAPYNDVAILVVDGEIYTLSDVNAVGDYGDSGWINTGLTGLSSGEHTVAIAVLNTRDTILDSAIYVDDFSFA